MKPMKHHILGSCLLCACIAVVALGLQESAVASPDNEVGENEEYLSEEAVEAESESPANIPHADEGFAARHDPLPADSSDLLDTCEWARASTSTDQFLYIPCASAQRPIGGGCYNSSKSAPITGNHPYEATSLNHPENEAWYNTAATAGWRCEKDGTAGTLTGLAMCCGD